MVSLGALCAAEPIASATADQPALVVFWRPDCPPCMLELDMIPAWSKKNPTLPIIIMSLADADTTQAVLSKKMLPANVQIHVAEAGSEMTLAAWGDGRYVLPYSVFIKHNGDPCHRHIGLLGSDQIHTWITQCKNASSSLH